jgi:EAL domain-containing protein (putative c-di-GMP-specific phosphodiesterase class I)
MTVNWIAYNPAVRVETDLHDCALRLARVNDSHQRTAVHLHLSKLQPSRRHEHHMRLATTTFDSLLMRYECRLFRLGNGDLMLVAKDTPLLEVDAQLAKLRGMFADDPLIYRAEVNGEGFATAHDISADPAAFQTRCDAILAEAEMRTRGMPSSTLAPPMKNEPRALDMQGLAMLDATLANTSIAPFLRQQAVVLISRDDASEIVFSELYVSIPDLQRALAPNADIDADPWILLGLTRLLDRRVLAHLNAAGAPQLPRPASLNLSLSGLDHDSLDALMRLQSRYRDWRTIIETPHLEPFVDLAGYMEKAARLREMGFRICLDGFCHHTLPLVDRDRLNADFLKVRWSPALEREGIAAPLERLAAAVKRAGTDRVVLCRCDSPGALAWGRSIGIALYQGRFIDFLHHGAEDSRHATELVLAARR